MRKPRALFALALTATLLSRALAGLAACCVPMMTAEDHSCCAKEAGFVAGAVSCCFPGPAHAEKATPAPAPFPLLTAERVAPVELSMPQPDTAVTLAVRAVAPASTPPLVLRI
jgi:putative Ca2+/H+ antiporter (TMEM165/GDT1 family)